MSTFKKLNTKVYQKKGPVITPDFTYWKNLEAPVLVKEFGAIDHIDFSPIEPYHFAVTSSVRVQIYNPITKLVAKNISRFRENAYGAVFRPDGRLILAGSEEASVKLFDVSTKNLLRLFKGHTSAVHRALFVPDHPQIVSFSDDKTVKLWDIPTEATLATFAHHTDYIRAGAVSATSPHTLLSGGYDGAVQLYDTRTAANVLTIDHGAPVEALLFLPSGGCLLSAGGTELKLWDLLAGGRLLGRASQHHKTITALCLASNGKRLLSASLDRHVKVYDVATLRTVHTLDYPGGVLSVGVSRNDDTLAVGLADGLVAISRRGAAPGAAARRPAARHAAAAHRGVDLVVAERTRAAQARHDACLRRFEFARALDCALEPYTANKRPQVTVAVLGELVRRRALGRALAGREARSVAALLAFLAHHLPDGRFARVLVDVANAALDAVEGAPVAGAAEVRSGLGELARVLGREVELAGELAGLEGAMQMLLAAGGAAARAGVGREVAGMTPSADAQENLVLEV